jgi:hypothetical protein
LIIKIPEWDPPKTAIFLLPIIAIFNFSGSRAVVKAMVGFV